MIKKMMLFVLLVVLTVFPSFSDERTGSVDFIFLVDTSLSMEDSIDEVKKYVASDLVGRNVIPGDWVSVVRFYGETETVWSGDIKNQEDIASVVRSLHELKANGRFTDIGKALDRMSSILDERKHPERPKYVLLITDERQEAPVGSRYFSLDYTVDHPLLEYIKRVDKGLFRVITVGYNIKSKINNEASSMLTILTNPPERPIELLPGIASPGDSADVTALVNANNSSVETNSTDVSKSDSSKLGSDSSLDSKTGSNSSVKPNAPTDKTAEENAKTENKSSFNLLLVVAIAVFVIIILALILFIPALRRKSRKNSDSSLSPGQQS